MIEIPLSLEPIKFNRVENGIDDIKSDLTQKHWIRS